MEQLVISAIGTHQQGLANDLCKFVTHCGCHIVDSRMTMLGSEWVAYLLLSGTWNALAKLETTLPGFAKKHGLSSMAKRTKSSAIFPERLPYSVYITCVDQLGVMALITNFFAEHDLIIHDMHVSNYQAPFSGILMLTTMLSISIPMSRMLADLRENFMVFCDEHNFDAVMEPQKN